MKRSRLFGTVASAGLACLTGLAAAQEDFSPVFASDSAKTGEIRAVEAGAPAAVDSARMRSATRRDSLAAKVARRGPYVGAWAGAAFGSHSARTRFSDHMASQAAAAGQGVLQGQDPVHVFFPMGLIFGHPLTRHFDATLRTEHFYYRVSGLAQKENESPTEFWYSNQAHLAGPGIRWLVPLSLISVDGRAGLYASYTHFWNFGPTGMRSRDGSLRARTKPEGAGYEIQLGFQQDFDRRWAYTAGLSFSRLSFGSDGDWSYVLPTSSGPASWSLGSMRFALQGMYQFGRRGGNEK